MKKVGVPFTPLRTPAKKVLAHPLRIPALGHLVNEPLYIQTDSSGIIDQVSVLERLLIFK
jgi:hypothetical protein